MPYSKEILPQKTNATMSAQLCQFDITRVVQIKI